MPGLEKVRKSLESLNVVSVSRFAPKECRMLRCTRQLHRDNATLECVHFTCQTQSLVELLESQRWNSIERPRHLVRCHLTVLQTPNLTALPETLESDSEFPALRLVDEEDVFLAIRVADRGAEDVEVFGGLDTSLWLLCQ
jgi:hypothetical protein